MNLRHSRLRPRTRRVQRPCSISSKSLGRLNGFFYHFCHCLDRCDGGLVFRENCGFRRKIERGIASLPKRAAAWPKRIQLDEGQTGPNRRNRAGVLGSANNRHGGQDVGRGVMCSVRILRRKFTESSAVTKVSGSRGLHQPTTTRSPLQLIRRAHQTNRARRTGGDQQQERPRRAHQGERRSVRASPAKSMPSQPRSTSNRLRSDRHNMARRTKDTALLSVIVTLLSYVRNERCHEIASRNVPNCGDRGRRFRSMHAAAVRCPPPP